jgi:protoporphyrinogen oxidase
MAKSFYDKDYIFDYGGHYLHFDNKEQFDFFHNFSTDIIEKERLSFIDIENQLVPYPIQIFYTKIFTEYKEKVNIELKNSKIDSSNYYNYLKSSFGETIFNKFFYPYNTKFWKTDLKEMDIEWTEKLVPKVSMDIIENPPERIGYNYKLYYPTKGISEISDNLAKDKNIYLNETVEKIDAINKIIYTDKNSYKYEFIISTIPITELLLKADIMKFNLDYLSVKILNIGVKGKYPKDFSWIYLPEDTTPFFRFGKYIIPDKDNKFSLYFEYSYKDEKILSDTLFLKEAKKLMDKFGISGEIETQMFLNLKYAYPILKVKEKGYVPIIFQQLHMKNIFPAGRMGSWKYISMNDSYEEAKRIKNIIENRL